MTKPGFLLKRIKLLFQSNDEIEKQKIINKYNQFRNKQKEKDCYCGHTIKCDCGNPGISEFNSALQRDCISENILNKIL
jgi:hypothetical protein